LLARLGIGHFNTLEALLGCDLLNKFAGGEIAFEERQNTPAAGRSLCPKLHGLCRQLADPEDA
jgi:hypothetical protein